MRDTVVFGRWLGIRIWLSQSIAIAVRLARPGPGERPPLPPISGYAPHPDRSAWILVIVLVTLLYLVLTVPR